MNTNTTLGEKVHAGVVAAHIEVVAEKPVLLESKLPLVRRKARERCGTVQTCAKSYRP
jgi:hypothetical protein